MKKISIFLFGILGACLLLGPTGAYAEKHLGVDDKGHYGKMIQEIYNQLNLTDDQKQKLEANKQQHMVKMGSFRQGLKTNREAIEQELMNTSMDMAKINAIHAQIKVLQAQMEDEKLSSILTVRSILTVDQFSKFVSLMHQKKKEHKE